MSRLRVAVYCASSPGRDPKYVELARGVGERFAREDIEIIYGGGRVGLMGALADAALEAGGRVIGVIPERLRTKEVAHEGLTELHVVQGMHARNPVNVPRNAGVQIELPPRARGVGPFWAGHEGDGLVPHTRSLIDGLVAAVGEWTARTDAASAAPG